MNRGKRLDIQALRAIAVLAVVTYHLWPNRLVGGFMGVDVFFVISGYLMTASLIRDAKPVLSATNKIGSTWNYLINFYARRIKRLVPAAAVTLLAILGLTVATGSYSLIQQNSHQIFTSALFVQNWQLANDSVDYLANTNPTAVQHFWSLSLEEQFYLVWPVLLLALLFVTTNLYIVYKNKKTVGAAIPVSILIVALFIYGYHLTRIEPSLAYFVTPARVWELLFGGLIAFLPTLRNYDLRLLLPWLGAGLIGYSFYQWNGVGFPGWHAIIPVVGTGLIIYAGTLASESKWSFENLLKFRPVQWIGDISYSLYLWHWPLIVLLPVLLFINLETHPQVKLIKISILMLSFVLAWLSYRFIEQPMLKLKIKKRYIYILFVTTTLVVGGLAYITHRQVSDRIQTGIKYARISIVSNGSDCVGANSILNKCKKSFGYIDPQSSQVASDDKYEDLLLDGGRACPSYDGSKNTGQDRLCAVGDLNSEHEITIWGDSHAQIWLNPMDKIGRENHIKVNIVGQSTCFNAHRYSVNCNKRFNIVKKNGLLDRSDAIIVSMFNNYKARSMRGNNSRVAIDKLHGLTANKSIYLLEDVPSSGREGGPECNVEKLSCKTDRGRALDQITKASVELVEDGYVNKKNIITTSDMFCDAQYCYSNIGGVQVYRDRTFGIVNNYDSINSHLTATYAMSTWKILEQKLKKAGII